MVDLPAPFGPMNPVTCPGETVKVMPSSACTRPNRLRSPATSMVFSMGEFYGTGHYTGQTAAVMSL